MAAWIVILISKLAGRSRRSSVVSTGEETAPLKADIAVAMRDKSGKPDSRPISRSVTFDTSVEKESDSDSSMNPYD